MSTQSKSIDLAARLGCLMAGSSKARQERAGGRVSIVGGVGRVGVCSFITNTR
ncbi:MAG: hypothetical protein AAGC88_02865 [Bacteroidota bacterium]